MKQLSFRQLSACDAGFIISQHLRRMKTRASHHCADAQELRRKRSLAVYIGVTAGSASLDRHHRTTGPAGAPAAAPLLEYWLAVAPRRGQPGRELASAERASVLRLFLHGSARCLYLALRCYAGRHRNRPLGPSRADGYVAGRSATGSVRNPIFERPLSILSPKPGGRPGGAGRPIGPRSDAPGDRELSCCRSPTTA